MPDGTGVDATMQCLFCGEQEHVEVFEVWGHDFMFHTCCEGLHEQIAYDMNDDPAWARRFLERLGIEELCGHELRRVADDDSCSLVLDWSLRIAPVTHDQARSFIARHHAHCRPPVMWRFHTGIFNGRTLLGVRRRRESRCPFLQRARDRRGQQAVHPAGHRQAAALECRLHALRLVRPGSGSPGLVENHHLHPCG